MPVNHIVDYLETPITDFSKPVGRYQLYFQLAGMFIFSIGLIVQFLPRSLSFKICYPIMITMIFCGAFYVMVEWCSRLTGEWGQFKNLSVGKLWMMALLSFSMAYGVQREAEYHVVPLYYDEASIKLIEGVVIFYIKVIIIWMFSLFWVLHTQLKRQLAVELKQLQRINDLPNKPEKRFKIENVQQQAPIFRLPEELSHIPVSSISHISVEEHYSKIFYSADSIFKEFEIRMPLKDILEKLPTDHFIQTHRSHVVCLSYVSRVVREKQAFRLFLMDGKYSIPMSRHRASQVLPMIESFKKADAYSKLS